MKFFSYYHQIFKTIEFYIFEKSKNNKIENKIKNSQFLEILEKLTVTSGPFKGMRYPSLKSHGSAIYPKILGTYERELSEVVNEIINKEYDLVIDIGCAEGYYAVGFALASKNSKIYAYDTSEEARKLCSDLVKINKVEGSVIIKEFFDLKEYLNILKENPNSKILIISDIEGYEINIFNNEFKKHLKNTDFLIELHDFENTDITNSMDNFVKNMNVVKIFSLSDFQKTLEYKDKIFEGIEFETKYYLLKEGRPEQMKWYYATSI